MGIFDAAVPPEVGNGNHDDTKLIRDKRGRLAVSRPCARSRRIADNTSFSRLQLPSRAPNTMIPRVDAPNAAENGVVIKQKPSKESVKATNLKSSKDSLEWGPAEDLQLLELRQDRKSWDYIAGKLDGKGKDLTAMKARFNELGLQKARERQKENKEETKVDEEKGEKKESTAEEKQEGSSSENGKKKKKDKSKRESTGAESDSASKKSEKGNPKPAGILKNSPKSDKTETNGKQETEHIEVQTSPVPIKPVPVEKQGYIGKSGRGEVRFFNGVPILYQHAGSDAVPLDAEAVALIMKEVSKYDRNKWLTIASRLLDKTGIQMDPEVVRTALEG